MNDQKWVEQAWADFLQEALSGSLGVPCHLEPAATPAAFAEALWWEQKFSIAPDALLWIGAPEETWSQIGDLALRAAGLESGGGAARRETYLEVIWQALAGFAESAAAKRGSPVTCERGREAAPGNGAAVLTLAVTAGSGPPLPVYTGFHPALLESLSEMHTSEQASACEVPVVLETPKQGGGGVYDLLLDVELPVSISFGRAILQLKEVLRLTSGSIVELNRGISEPVDVIVNNCVVARGEVVVVDGNYGVRIREIVSRQERLRTLD